MKKLLGRLAAVAGVAAMATTATVVAPQEVVPTLATASAITCQSGGDEWASPTYENNFTGRIDGDHYLTSYVPQSVTTWHDWNGGTADVFLVAMYHADGGNSLVYAMTPDGNVVGGFKIKETHAGGIAVRGSYIYITDADNTKVRRYSKTSVRNAVAQRIASAARMPYVTYYGTLQSLGYAASFMYVYDGRLYAGKFNSSSRDWMYRYEFGTDGRLSRDTDWARRQVPLKTQGLVVQQDRYFFSTSWGRGIRSNVYVTTRDYTTNFETQARSRCFHAPPMAEGMAVYQGKVYLLFESGASEYDGSEWRTKKLHVASVSGLASLV
ncbi:hypothetical protein [Promicromonospora soli]|uniref:Uncharacterized protein n=1 Tax=Promicromonospora soli TaxID=2035533 RepID=A0A919FFN5_9MICO|nr:hypothetical protein [Promicromonospora soli]GHH64234.1 hypothetical protein GCM10017772_00280 [Promicromonospora soli]